MSLVFFLVIIYIAFALKYSPPNQRLGKNSPLNFFIDLKKNDIAFI